MGTPIGFVGCRTPNSEDFLLGDTLLSVADVIVQAGMRSVWSRRPALIGLGCRSKDSELCSRSVVSKTARAGGFDKIVEKVGGGDGAMVVDLNVTPDWGE